MTERWMNLCPNLSLLERQHIYTSYEDAMRDKFCDECEIVRLFSARDIAEVQSDAMKEGHRRGIEEAAVVCEQRAKYFLEKKVGNVLWQEVAYGCADSIRRLPDKKGLDLKAMEEALDDSLAKQAFTKEERDALQQTCDEYHKGLIACIADGDNLRTQLAAAREEGRREMKEEAVEIFTREYPLCGLFAGCFKCNSIREQLKDVLDTEKEVKK